GLLSAHTEWIARGPLWHGGSVACTACTAASQQEGHGFDSCMGRCWLWGAVPPQSAQCSGGLSPRPFCVEFACSPCVHKGFLHKEPQPKNMHTEEQIALLSQTVLVPAREKGWPLLLCVHEKVQCGCVCVCVSVCVCVCVCVSVCVSVCVC